MQSSNIWIFKLTSFYPKNKNPSQPPLQITEVIHFYNGQVKMTSYTGRLQSPSRSRYDCKVGVSIRHSKTSHDFSTRFMYSLLTITSYVMVFSIFHIFFYNFTYCKMTVSIIVTSHTSSHQHLIKQPALSLNIPQIPSKNLLCH